MKIEEAKQVRIVDFLAQMGHHAQYVKSEQYWYLSPFRAERTPSFKVNDRLNEWYDFAEATGGDLVELGKYLFQTDSVSEVLGHIERHVAGGSLPKIRVPTVPPRPVESEGVGGSTAAASCAVVVPELAPDRRGHRADVLPGGAL